MSCIFCKIIKGVIPAEKIYADKKVLAFLDIKPVNPGHTLIIPKSHYSNLEEIPEEDLCSLIKACKIVGQKIINGLKVTGYNLTENNNPIAGQIIPHIHFHLIPRQAGDGHKLWAQREYQEGEAEEVRQKIIKSSQ